MRTQQEQARLDADRKQRWESQQRADKLHAEQLRAESQRQQQQQEQARRDQERKQRENQLDTERRNAEYQRRQESERARLATQQEQSNQQARETVQRREAAQQREADDRRRASQDQLEKSRYEAQLKATKRNTLVTGLGAAAVVYSIYDTAPARQTTPPPLPSTDEVIPFSEEEMAYTRKKDTPELMGRVDYILGSSSADITMEMRRSALHVKNCIMASRGGGPPPLPAAGSRYINGVWRLPNTWERYADEYHQFTMIGKVIFWIGITICSPFVIVGALLALLLTLGMGIALKNEITGEAR
jgi:hypothetical protein